MGLGTVALLNVMIKELKELNRNLTALIALIKEQKA